MFSIFHSYGGIDTIVGGQGNDTLELYLYNDSENVFVNNTGSTVTLPNGIQFREIEALNISLGDGNDTINGWIGNDAFSGNVGNDSLVGRTGDDSLAGDAGNDSLVAGVGSDQFVYNYYEVFTAAAFGTDTISDFETGIDKIVLGKQVFYGLNSLPGVGFSVATDFAIVSSDISAATSGAAGSMSLFS